MNSRDDIVFRPDIGPAREVSPAARARLERRLARLRSRGGVLNRVAQARVVRSVARRGVAIAAGSLSGIGSPLAHAATSFNPASLLVKALVIGSLAAIRLASGRPFAGLAETANRALLGDLDDQARAKASARSGLEQDEQIMRIVGQEGRVNSQIAGIFDIAYQLQLTREKGASLLREQFASDGTLDMLIVRARDVIVRNWKGNGGPEVLEKIGDALRESAGKDSIR